MSDKLAKCPLCGCRWRDNQDGSMSLADEKQKSCGHCDRIGWDGLMEIAPCTCPMQVLMTSGCQCGGK